MVTIYGSKKIKVADNFTLYEFLKSSSYPEFVKIPSDDIIEMIKEFAQNTFQKIRNKFGKTIIHSGYRNKLLNKYVGGVKNSVHQYILNGNILGKAGDFSVNWDKYPIEEVFKWIIDNHEDLGIKTAIIYRKPNVVKYNSRFIHIDTRRRRKQFTALEKFGKNDYRYFDYENY